MDTKILYGLNIETSAKNEKQLLPINRFAGTIRIDFCLRIGS
jgi:hypothetical protein